MFEELLQAWDGEEAVIRFDRESGAWMFVCVHSTVLGPAGGGTRLRVYARPGDGLADAMQLSQAMTQKMAAAGMPRGGGKGVLAVPALPEGEARRALLLRYAELVTSLGGTFHTAGDMNITPADLDVVAERCPWVYGTTGRGGNSGRGTARGVLHGIRASVEHVFGSHELAGRSVLIQGVGAVGGDLARGLAQEGAEVLVSDLDTELAARVAAEVGGAAVAPADALATACDVFSPCAAGGILGAETISRLRCRIVAGSANQPARRPRGRGAAPRGGDPLRPRLRDQRRRRPPAPRPGGARLGRGRARAQPRRHRRHAARALRRGGRRADHAVGGGGASCSATARRGLSRRQRPGHDCVVTWSQS
jgi:leucine dehydrogenase